MKKYKFKSLFFIIPALALFGAFAIYEVNKTIRFGGCADDAHVIIKNKTIINIEIADEPKEQWQGLSDRNYLGANNAMLFIFPKKQVRTFVMRRMHFPLDIIWIDGDKIIKIDKRLEPEGESPIKRYSSPIPVNYVLEVNGGFTDAYGIKAGDRVEMNY